MRLADNRRRALAAAIVLIALLALGFLLGTATTAGNGSPVSSEQLIVAERQAQRAAQTSAQSTAVTARAVAATASAHAARLAAQLALVRSCVAPRHTAVMRCVRAALR